MDGDAVVRRSALENVNRVVVKVGSGVISGKGRLRPSVMKALAHDVSHMMKAGCEVVMVASGAVAAGYASLGLPSVPTNVAERQASACIGQYRLVNRLSEAFAKYRIGVAQLLIMEGDIEDRRRFLSARHVLQMLLARGVVPVINENDPLANEQATLGDNDHLAAMVSNLVSAQLLVILSSVDGLYAEGTRRVIPTVRTGASVSQHVFKETSATGVGGMEAKVRAAGIASRGGVPTIIARGEAGSLTRIMSGEPVGTLFLPSESRLSARKRWIVFRVKSRGALTIDAGARKALRVGGASLLPAGVIKVEGRFQMGARVDVRDLRGDLVAVGLVSYASHEIERMMGLDRRHFKGVLGYEYVDEIIHRDDMVLWTEDSA
ncbi:MAG: glutamate 5-kinase [Phycisphaerae bacterium]